MAKEVRNMRVLSLIWGCSGGGVDQVVLTYARLGDMSNVEVDTVCIHAENWETDRDSFRGIGASFVPFRNRTEYSWIRRTSELIENRRPDLVFVHGFNGPIIARLCQRYLKKDFPFVCSYHGLYHAPKLSRVPLQPIFNGGLHYIYRRHAHGIVAVAEHCRKFLISRRVLAEKIITIHNGIPVRPHHETIPTRADVRLRDDEFVIGVASRVDPVKGLKYLVDAFARVLAKFPRARLLVLGRGTQEEKLKRQCARLGIADKARFAGYKDNVDMWLDLFDVFALPSLAEYHSIGLLEAMRAGKAIVATTVGGNPESVQNEEQALLVPPADSIALEKALIRLAGDSNLCKRLGRNAQKGFEEEFAETRTLEKTAEWLLSFHKGK